MYGSWLGTRGVIIVCVCVCLCVECVWIGLCAWVCVCVWVCIHGSVVVTPTAAQGRVTSSWCGGETRGGIPLGQHAIRGATKSSRGSWVARSRAPPLAGHRGGATVAQGGLHRGLAVYMGSPGLPVAQPASGLVRCHQPAPLHLLCSCTGASWAGDRMRRGAPRGPSDTGARRGHQCGF